MGFGGGPKPPSVSMPPPAAHPAVLGSGTVDAQLRAQKDRATSTNPFTADKTIATSPQGIQTAPTTARPTLLGQ
jgi:hypothetical protein